MLSEAALFAMALAVLVTACGWLIAGKASPVNHGVTPEVRENPPLGLWVFANFPAAILFLNAFGKLGSEAQYSSAYSRSGLCLGGSLLGSLARYVQRPDRYDDRNT